MCGPSQFVGGINFSLFQLQSKRESWINIRIKFFDVLFLWNCPLHGGRGGGRGGGVTSRGRIVGRNPDRSLRVFLLVIHSYSTSTALPWDFYFFKLTQPLKLLKEDRGKPDRKPYPLPYGLWNPYRNLKSENSQDYSQKPQWALNRINTNMIGPFWGKKRGWIFLIKTK